MMKDITLAITGVSLRIDSTMPVANLTKVLDCAAIRLHASPESFIEINLHEIPTTTAHLLEEKKA